MSVNNKDYIVYYLMPGPNGQKNKCQNSTYRTKWISRWFVRISCFKPHSLLQFRGKSKLYQRLLR